MRCMQIRRFARVGAIAALACLCAVPLVLGQTTRARLTGTVTDPNGAVVPGAVVTATNVATNISNSTNTDQEGTYTFTALPPGEYTVAVELTGFKRNVVTGVILQIAETSRLDIPLEVGAVTEEVSVRQPGATRPEHVERAGAGHRLQADSVAPAQRPPLSAAHHADAGSGPRGICRLCREPRRRRRTERRPSQRERPAVVGQQLPARRRGQQRAAQRLREHHAAARSAAGVQGPDEQPDRRVRRVRRRGRQPEHPLRHQPVQRIGVRVLPRRVAQRA